MEPNLPVQPVQQHRLPKWLVTITPFSKILAMILFILLPFVGFYLGTKYQEKLTVTNPLINEAKTDPIKESSTGFKSYSNLEIGIGFEYPASWNSVVETDELCLPVGGFSRIVDGQPCVGIYLSTPIITNNTPFFSTQSKLFPEHGPGRGGSWVDSLSIGKGNEYSVSSVEKDMDKLCLFKETFISCKKEMNKNGFVYVKVLREEGEMGSDKKTNTLFYYVLSKNQDFPGFILSNKELIDVLGYKDSEIILDHIVNSFRSVN